MALTKIKADGLTADLIDETKLADNSIDSEHYNDGSIDTAHVADDAVTADKLANAINTDIAAKAVLTGSTNNTITTVTGANAIQGEANLTFDGTNLGIGSTVTRSGLTVALGGNSVPSAGSTDGAAVFGNALGDAAYGLVCGATSSGSGYIQAQRTDGTASTYDLLMQPNGGNIGFNRTNVDAGDSSTQTSTATPKRIVFNNDYSNGYTDASLKVYLFNDGTTRQGFTSGPAYDIQYHTSGSATGKHSFYVANTKEVDIDSDGLKFNGDTAAANALNDYEEGSWSPSISYGTSNSGLSITESAGLYVKVGRFIHLSAMISWNEGSSSGPISITGLPYVTKNNNNTRLGGHAMYLDGFSGLSGSNIFLYGTGNSSTASMYFVSGDNDSHLGPSDSAVTHSETSSGNTTRFVISYYTDS